MISSHLSINTLVLSVLIFLISCKNSSTKDNTIIDDLKTEQHLKNTGARKADRIIYSKNDDSFFVDTINIKRSKKLLDKKEWINLGLDTIEQFNEQYKYSILNSFNYNNNKILLIERESVTENIHWLTLFDANYIIIDFLQSAYNNSERLEIGKSEIYKNKIITKYWNINAKMIFETKQYFFTNKELC